MTDRDLTLPVIVDCPPGGAVLTVTLEREALARLRAYAKAAKVSPEHAIEDAVLALLPESDPTGPGSESPGITAGMANRLPIDTEPLEPTGRMVLEVALEPGPAATLTKVAKQEGMDVAGLVGSILEAAVVSITDVPPPEGKPDA